MCVKTHYLAYKTDVLVYFFLTEKFAVLSGRRVLK